VFGTGPDESASPPAAAGDEASLVLELSSTDTDEPAATLRFGDQEQEGALEGWSWCDGDDCSGGIADFVHYPPVFGYVVVPPGTAIEVAGDGAVERLRISTLEDEPVQEPGGPMTVPASNGAYVVEVDAVWEGANHGSANFFFGVQALDSPASAPDVLRVGCGSGSPLTETAVVRAQGDGLHVEVSAGEGISAYSVIEAEGDPNEYAVVGSSVPSDVMPIAPGSWEFACKESGQQDDTDPTASFELVDPDDHYASPELSCDAATEQAFTSAIPGSTPPEEAAAQLVTGLAEGDVLRGAGYGVETFKVGPAYVVEHGGDSVARLTLGAESDPWAGTLTVCQGSGIELAEGLGPRGSIARLEPEPSATPLPGEPVVPDVLVVRCEGLGPAVDATHVRLQADGLHVEATNVADAVLVELVPAFPEPGDWLHRVTFDRATERFVVPEATAGEAWVGCFVTDEEGGVVGPTGDEQSYVPVEVLPAEG
jgi:hypothetical protein